MIEFKKGLLTVLDRELDLLISTDCVETGKHTTVEVT